MAVVKLIRGPAASTLDLLMGRLRPNIREQLAGKRWDAVGLVQASIPELFAIADGAVKAANVVVVEVPGQCPQHLSTIAVLGDLQAVETALAPWDETKNK